MKICEGPLFTITVSTKENKYLLMQHMSLPLDEQSKLNIFTLTDFTYIPHYKISHSLCLLALTLSSLIMFWPVSAAPVSTSSSIFLGIGKRVLQPTSNFACQSTQAPFPRDLVLLLINDLRAMLMLCVLFLKNQSWNITPGSFL